MSTAAFALRTRPIVVAASGPARPTLANWIAPASRRTVSRCGAKRFQPRQSQGAAGTLLRRAVDGNASRMWVVITDKPASYPLAGRRVLRGASTAGTRA